MMNFNLLRDIVKQIRQFYYLKLNLYAQYSVTRYVMIHFRSPPNISYVHFTSLILEKILKARYILKEFPNAIFYTKKN